jgi:murein L,D-transpeptidase YafK
LSNAVIPLFNAKAQHFICYAFMPQNEFLHHQQTYERVRTAFDKKEKTVVEALTACGVEIKEMEVLFVAYKAEQLLEVYAKRKTAGRYQKINHYTVCASSGTLGPKRKQGDLQVPEGFYCIDRYNPVSHFFLSLGLNYPNASDRLLGKGPRLGGDIFIHGACVTVGCLPMTDDKIMEIYLYALHARNNGQLHVPVYIFPFVMHELNMEKYKKMHQENGLLLNFWSNLKEGFDRFQKEMTALDVQVESNGAYAFRSGNQP